jgi:hypothetical protein
MALLEAGEPDEPIRELRIVASEEAWRDLPAVVLGSGHTVGNDARVVPRAGAAMAGTQ